MSAVLQMNLLPESNRLSHLKASQLSLPEQETLVGLALEILSLRYRPGVLIDQPDRLRDYLRLKLGELEHEVFAVILLDNRHRILCFEEMFRGTIDGASVHPREVVKIALQHNAAACVMTHNHPSGIAEPSQADLSMTLRLKEALALIDIRVLDHMIVTRESMVSLAERGQL